MPRHMSVAETEQSVVDRIKTETRRLGWWQDKNGRRLLMPGDRLVLCRKVMGRRRPDGSVEPLVRLAEVEVTSVHREPLREIGEAGVAAEAVPVERFDELYIDVNPPVPPVWEWIRWYCETFDCRPSTEVTVIRWRYLDGVGRG